MAIWTSLPSGSTGASRTAEGSCSTALPSKPSRWSQQLTSRSSGPRRRTGPETTTPWGYLSEIDTPLGFLCHLAVGRNGPIRFVEIRARFAGRRHILRARPLQNLFGAFCPIRIVAVHGKQDASLFDPAFVALGFVFRNAGSDEGASQPTNCSHSPCPC